MAYEMKEGNVFLHSNKYHKKGDNQPCLKGSGLVDGTKREFSVWAPKPGKAAYFMVVKIHKDEPNQPHKKPMPPLENIDNFQEVPPAPIPSSEAVQQKLNTADFDF
jgi:hypothetical protein